MPTQTRILLSQSYDPYFNLAVENFIFQSMEPSSHVLFLWRNADTVVIGKGQNPWTECNLKKMERDSVKLARRQTGGGAVFHDLGNTNYTFMSGKPGYDKSTSTQIVLRALSDLGIKAEASGRNDLVISVEAGSLKFSGSAYRETKDRGFHHGTLLIHADLARLASYLNPDPKKLKSKGIQSVRSRVCNLRDVQPTLDHQVVCEAVQTAFNRFHGSAQAPELIDPEHISSLPGFEEMFQQQSHWDWNYGKSPQFSHTLSERFAWGGVEVHLDVQRAVIVDAKIFTDSLYPDLFGEIEDHLRGVAYSEPDSIRASVMSVSGEEHRLLLDEFFGWFLEAVK